jgi:hypothetical protein
MLLLAAAVTAAAAQAPQEAVRSPRNASYTIRARLDPAARTISGDERIAWRNITANATSELQFHLYWSGCCRALVSLRNGGRTSAGGPT